MATTLIILAHPNRNSFCGAWADATAAAARAAGDTVLWADLSGAAFDPREGADHYPDPPQGFDPLKAQEAGPLPMQVAEHVDMIRRADRLVFHFPIWWFAPPAVLKGWFDRVLAHGTLHNVEERFDTGRCRGKSALFCVTTGATASECGLGGKEGDLRLLLWPSAYTLRYLGMSVLEPECVHGVHGYHEGAAHAALEARLSEVLANQASLYRSWSSRPRVAFNSDAEFTEEGRLRASAPSHSPFIRHPGDNS